MKARVRRGRPGGPSGWQTFEVSLPAHATVVDLLETIKGQRDPSLVFRHSCHHGSCGTCAALVNGVERLTCVTQVAEVMDRSGTVRIEPIRHLPPLADVAVDPTPLYRGLQQLGPGHLRPLSAADLSAWPVEAPGQPSGNPGRSDPAHRPVHVSRGGPAPPAPDGAAALRFATCIECGACVSACPVAGAPGGYLGPAALAAFRDALTTGQAPGVGWHLARELADGEHGVWQCHQAFECSRVCPAGVDPGGAIMALRRGFLREYRPGSLTERPTTGGM